jgi:hypothetical protein
VFIIAVTGVSRRRFAILNVIGAAVCLTWCPRSSVLTDHDRRDSLPHDRLGSWVVPQRPIAVRVNVDEAGRHDEPAHIEFAAPRIAQPAPDRDQTSVVDGDVSLDSGAPAAIDDVAAHTFETSFYRQDEERVLGPGGFVS